MEIFDSHFAHWVYPFFASSLLQSAVTTGLTAYRLWRTYRQTSNYRSGPSFLIPVLLILVESTALLVFAEFTLLVLYAFKNYAIALFFDSVTPLVGITFSIINIRIALQLYKLKDRSPNCTSVFLITGYPDTGHLIIEITKQVHSDHGDPIYSDSSADGTLPATTSQVMLKDV